MRRIFLITLIGLLFPLAAAADSSDPQAMATVGPTASQTATDSSGSSANALQSTGSASSSPQTGGILQPTAGSDSPLQSAAAGSSGVAQSGTQDIQQGAADAQTQLMVQADGEGVQTLDSGTNWGWLGYVLMVLGVAVVLTAAIVFWQRRLAARTVTATS